MDIKEFEELNRKIEQAKIKENKLNTAKSVVISQLTTILSKYGISDIKQYKKLYELRDQKIKEAEEYKMKAEAYIESIEQQWSSVEDLMTKQMF